jgi:hypothetical protein
MQQDSGDTSWGAVQMDDRSGNPITAAPLFTGFVETGFSSSNERYFYMVSKKESELWAGGFALIEQYVAPPFPWLTLWAAFEMYACFCFVIVASCFSFAI